MKLFFEMLSEGGIPVVVISVAGIVCTIWGAVQLFPSARKSNRVIHLACSLLPAAFGLWLFWQGYRSYEVVADTKFAPRVEEFHEFVSLLVIYGMTSLFWTVVPIGLGIAGLLRKGSSVAGA